MKLKADIAVIVLSFLGCIAKCQTFCRRNATSEWRVQPKVHVVKWFLTQNICSDFYTDCWNACPDQETNAIENVALRYPQICPLQLQLGDTLFIASEPSFQPRGMNLANVSSEEFIQCPRQTDIPQKQLIFGCRLNGMHQVEPKWLGIGTHYFIEVPTQGPLLCQLGLRLNITVKPQLCQRSPSAPFCSGRGKCLSHIWDEAYTCHCNQPFSGQFCQEYDVCVQKPCYNNASCIGRGNEGDHDTKSYRCICPPLFAGENCSEIIGQCQPHSCQHGKCTNVSPNTYRCHCDEDATGPFCEEHVEPCSSQPCQNKAMCHNTPSGYACDCPAGFLGHDCGIEIDECHSRPCQNGGTCRDMPNDVTCLCLPTFIGKFCERSVTPCEPSPCLNSGSCIEEMGSYHCSCMPGYTGRNCEQVIDYCGLLSINCLNEGLCRSLIGGFVCLCAPGWTGEVCQFVEDACLIYPDNCHGGATCVDVSQSKLQPQIKCVCPAGFTGAFCEMENNECDSSPCKHGGSCKDGIGHFQCTCPLGFEGQQCEIDIDACLLHNITCSPGAQCVDKPYEFAYMCRTACQENEEFCANGGRCFHDEDNQGYHCVCPPGWTGPACLDNINDCEVSCCKNGGTCEDGINEYRCLCPPGYSGTFCEVTLDPCIQNRCSDYGFCLPILNNYTCHCRLGYEGPFCEVEANECSSSPCRNGATCLDLIGHFSCQCAGGFKGETCTEVAERCADKPCRNGATCEEAANDFRCDCPFGFSGQFCEKEASACDSGPCLNSAACVGDVNGYDCFCPEGFEGLNCEINFDDCSYAFCKSNSTCLDLVADYICVCPPGFTDKNCSMDIDECASKPCKNGASCYNSIGKFYCNCLPGFTGEFCERNIGGCLSQPCGVLNLCRDELDGYHCFCRPGFIGHNCDIEVDECLSAPCHNGATCVDQLNAFSCLCSNGFQGTLCEININECHSDPCLHNATCTDIINGYTCACLFGFTGMHCETDIDDCVSLPCKNGGTCIDQPGNYYCQCVVPFKGFNCEFRPCEGGNPCENGAVCLKEMDLSAFPLGFQCQCRKGFTGPRCEININECHSNPCLHGYCYDVVDGFYCLCNPGYAGEKCDQDVDDCIINACEHNSTCLDLHLGYQCICLPGWEGPFCESEANECDSDPCRNNGTCIDLFDGFRCVCAAGWTGQQCSEDINECDSDPCLNGATCYESTVHGQFLCVCPPFYIGQTCQYRYNPCDAPYNPCINNSTCLAQVDGKPLCICQKGFGGTYCEIDNNECISGPCKNHGHCVDGVNSYRCFCRDGFSGIRCEVEINECLSRPCANGGTCIDLINRFLCNCPPGYYGSLCELDVNECETRPCLHGGSCFNKPGGYMCTCAPGFTGSQCEVDTNECASAPCLNNGSCVDDINFYTCHCRSGFIGINCETNANECLSAPCLHGRCIDLIDGYQCHCEAGWTSSRCTINVNECESAPCLNGGSCQDLVNAFECTCLSGYTGEFCEVDIDVCTEPLLNSSLCFNGGKCVDGPGRTFYCRCPAGFSGAFCETNINECSSSPCLHDSICEDLINGYFCRCQKGWEGFHCEEDINECAPKPCMHGICVQNEPGLGYTCYCEPGFVGQSCELNYDDCLIQTCPAGFLCVDGINNITCLPAIPQRGHIITNTEGTAITEALPRGLTQPQSSLLTSDISASQTSTDLEKTDFPSHGILATSSMSKLMSSILFQRFGLGSLTTGIESSAEASSLTSSGEVPTSPLLGYVGLFSTRTKSNITAVSHSVTESSGDVSLGLLSQDEYNTTSFVTESLMTIPVPPVLHLSGGNHTTLAISATDFISVISSIQETKSGLNIHSLFSPQFQPTTPAIACCFLSRLPQENTRQPSAVPLVSINEEGMLPNPMVTFVFPSEGKSVEKSFSSSVMLDPKRQKSLQNGYLDLSVLSFNQGFTDLSLRSASSLCKLKQPYVREFSADIKLSGEPSGHVLLSNDSPFYKTIWMSSVILTSWFALMKSTTNTSGPLVISAFETAASVQFTELPSLYPAERSKGTFRAEDHVLTMPLQELNTDLSNIYLDRAVSVLSPTLCLEPSLSTITASQRGNIGLMSKLYDVDMPTVVHTSPFQDNLPYEPAEETPPLRTQHDTSFISHLSDGSVEENKRHLTYGPQEYALQQQINLGKILNWPLTYDDVSQTGSGLEFLGMCSWSPLCSDMTSCSELSDYSLPTQTEFAKRSMPQYLSFPDTNQAFSSALTGMSSSSQVRWSTRVMHEKPKASLNICVSQSHSISATASPVSLFLLAPSDFSYIHYQENSYMEFQGFNLHPQNNISLEFQTTMSQGVLLYIEQNPRTVGHLFIQLYINNGFVQYQFACDIQQEIRNISTHVKVNDGQKYSVQIRQDLVRCEAELTILGITTEKSTSSYHWSSLIWQATGPIFIGGLPHRYARKQMSESICNFTGCLEVTEINDAGPFTFRKALDRHNIKSCRFPPSEGTSTAIMSTFSGESEASKGVSPSLTHQGLLPACPENLCQNGGTCQQITLPDGVASFQCDCPLHFTGRFCEKDTTLFFPSFSANSYLVLPSLSSLAEGGSATGPEQNRMTIYLTVRTGALNGTLLYTSDEPSGEYFLHLYLLDGRPTAQFGCGTSANILTVTANHSITRDALLPITISYALPFANPEGYCLIEMMTDENSPLRQGTPLPHQLTQVTFGPIFLGNVPPHVKSHPSSGPISGFQGCIREFQVNDKELFIIDEALGGRNIENCNVPVCDHHPCRNGGTCTSDPENWFCECPAFYSGKLCQFSTCEETPCGNGATCVPKSSQDAVCLCPYGRAGILCNDVINITYPSYSGTDAFGYTSFLAYSTFPSISLYYEFHLKFRLANHDSSVEDNLIFFTGQKGQGLSNFEQPAGSYLSTQRVVSLWNSLPQDVVMASSLDAFKRRLDRFLEEKSITGLSGDDFLVLGLRNGSVVYTYNLGSGTATIISEPLDLTHPIHIVSLGRSLQEGWMKVDDHENKTTRSPGKLVGLNVFSQFYVGGYLEYIPELLPNGSHFKNGFLGCIFDIQVRTGRDQKLKAPGIPEGHPNAGRSVGQCEKSLCQLIECRNGGTCVERGSTLYCHCSTGWKGAFCTETISVCDPEHNPPPKCHQGSTCVPLPDGYTCLCPLGTTGVHCEQALTISDASFNSSQSSWMSFDSFNIRHKVHIQMQFQTHSANGILFYTAQHLSPRSGDFLSLSLVNGYVQLRYNLGDRTLILQTFQNVPITNNTWYLIKAGRVGNEGYLDFDGINITQKASGSMTALDTHTDFYVGGVSSLHLVNPMAVSNEPISFTGCIREVFVNNKELELNEKGAKGGSNVGDCDGTACGYRVCRHNGKCKVKNAHFNCLCPKQWMGQRCEQSTYCSHSKCLNGGLCTPNPVLLSYTCACRLGWSGFWCEKQTSFFTARFLGNSYIKYVDPIYKARDLRFTKLSFNFTTTKSDGLLVWLGKAEDDDNDFLAVGLVRGMLKVVVNLGERIAVPLIHRSHTLCCNKWHSVTVTQNNTVFRVYLDGELVVHEDLDPQRKYIVLNYGGICYFGGFGLDRRVNIVTSGLFSHEFFGKIKDVALFQDSKKIALDKGEGYNVYSGDKD